MLKSSSGEWGGNQDASEAEAPHELQNLPRFDSFTLGRIEAILEQPSGNPNCRTPLTSQVNSEVGCISDDATKLLSSQAQAW